MTIDLGIRMRAEELFVVDGLKQEEVATELGMATRTVANWSIEDEWVKKRREYRSFASQTRRYETLARLELIKKAATTLDPQLVYAFAALQKIVNMKKNGEVSVPSEPALSKRDIQTPQDAIMALWDAITYKLNHLLAQPDTIDLKKVEELKKAMALVEELKSRYRTKDDQTKGLSDESAAEIREKILGII